MIDPHKLAAFAKPDVHAPVFAEIKEVDKFAELRPAIKQFAVEVEECCDEIDPDALRDLETEMGSVDISILEQGVAQLDSKLQQVLPTTRITVIEAADVGMQLQDEGVTTNGDRFAGWLYRVGQHASALAD